MKNMDKDLATIVHLLSEGLEVASWGLNCFMASKSPVSATTTVWALSCSKLLLIVERLLRVAGISRKNPIDLLYYVVDESWFLIHCIISNGKIYLIRKSSLLSTCFQIMHSWKCVVCKLRHITPYPKNTIFQSSLACTFASKNIMVLALWSNEKHIHGKWLEVYKSLEYGIKSNKQYSIDFYKLALFDSNEILT